MGIEGFRECVKPDQFDQIGKEKRPWIKGLLFRFSRAGKFHGKKMDKGEEAAHKIFSLVNEHTPEKRKAQQQKIATEIRWLKPGSDSEKKSEASIARLTAVIKKKYKDMTVDTDKETLLEDAQTVYLYAFRYARGKTQEALLQGMKDLGISTDHADKFKQMCAGKISTTDIEQETSTTDPLNVWYKLALENAQAAVNKKDSLYVLGSPNVMQGRMGFFDSVDGLKHALKTLEEKLKPEATPVLKEHLTLTLMLLKVTGLCSSKRPEPGGAPLRKKSSQKMMKSLSIF